MTSSRPGPSAFHPLPTACESSPQPAPCPSFGQKMRLSSNKENAVASTSASKDLPASPSFNAAAQKPRVRGIGRPRAPATKHHPVLLKGKRAPSAKRAKIKASIAKKRADSCAAVAEGDESATKSAQNVEMRTTFEGTELVTTADRGPDRLRSAAMTREIPVSLSPLGITSPKSAGISRFSPYSLRTDDHMGPPLTPHSAPAVFSRLPATPQLGTERPGSATPTLFSRIPSGLLSDHRPPSLPPIRLASCTRPVTAKGKYWAANPSPNPAKSGSALSSPRRFFSAGQQPGLLPHPSINYGRSASYSTSRIQPRAPQFMLPGQGPHFTQPPPPLAHVHPVAQHPFSGLHIGPSAHAHYTTQLEESLKEPLDQYGPRGETSAEKTPEEVYSGNRYNDVLATRYRKYMNDFTSGRYENMVPPIMVPILEKFTTLFPATPARYLLGLDGNVVYPFHVLPRKLHVPPIPPVTHTVENGSRVPVDYVLRNLIDHLPLVLQMTELYSLAFKHMQQPAVRSNTPVYSFGTRIDDTHDTATFWNPEAVSYGGLNINGRRVSEMRGPNVVLVVRQDADVASPGTLVPVNKTVMAMQCSHFTRLVNQGRSLRSRGDTNSNWTTDNAARRKVSSDILAAKMRGEKDTPVSQLLSPLHQTFRGTHAGIKAQAESVETRIPSTGSSQRRAGLPTSSGPVGTRAPSLVIVPTPPITIRHQTGSPARGQHPGSPVFATGNMPAQGEAELGGISEPESDGIYSTHITSDIGSVSCISSESGDSDEDDDKADATTASELKTILESVASDQDTHMPARPPATLRPHSTFPHPLYNSATPLVGQAAISPGNTHELYGVKSLPILSLYLPDLSTLPAILRHLHHPKETLLPTLLGWDAKANIATTAALQARLYEISAYDLLVRAERFYRLVKNLIALGIGAKATWDQVHLAHNCLNQVLYARGAIPNPQLDKIAVPYMQGENLPPLSFSTYTNEMIDVHNHWRSMREAKAQATGLIPPEEG